MFALVAGGCAPNRRFWLFSTRLKVAKESPPERTEAPQHSELWRASLESRPVPSDLSPSPVFGPYMTSLERTTSAPDSCSALQLNVRLTAEGWWHLPEPLADQLRDRLPHRLGPEPLRPLFGDINAFWEDTPMGPTYRSPATPELLQKLLPDVRFQIVVPTLTLASAAVHVPRISQKWVIECDVNALTAYRFGQLLIPTRDSAFAAIADLTTAFPASPVVLLVDRMGDATELQRRLRPLIGEAIAISQGLRGTVDCRVTAMTSRGNMENLTGRVVIAWMNDGELGRRMARSAYFAASTRFYIVRLDTWLLPRVETEMLYRFGPVLFSTRPELGTLTFSSLRCQPKSIRSSPTFQKRMLWNDPWRTGVLARLSRHVANSGQTVWTIVESLAHARQLSRLCPSVPIVSWRAGTKIGRDAIVTLSAVEELPPAESEGWIVYAAGGPASRVLRAWVERTLRAGVDLRIVDIDGVWHSTEVKNSQCRLRMLRSLGGHFRPLPRDALRAAFR